MRRWWTAGAGGWRDRHRGNVDGATYLAAESDVTDRALEERAVVDARLWWCWRVGGRERAVDGAAGREEGGELDEGRERV